jgi:hypothetical protein
MLSNEERSVPRISAMSDWTRAATRAAWALAAITVPSALDTRLLAMSTNASSAPFRLPIWADDTTRAKSWPHGRRNRGAVLTSSPFCSSMVKPSLIEWVRYSGMKASSTTMSRLPVPRRPNTSHEPSIT